MAVSLSQAQQKTAPTPTSTTPQDSQLQQRFPRYKLQPGDSFDVTFEFSPEFNQTMVVQPDGFIVLRGAGTVHIADETISQATDTIRNAYTQILYKPSITIVLKDFVKPYFTVDGQVGKPGRYELHGNTTVTEAVAMAGGFLASAKHSQVLLFRRVSDDWMQARIINVKAMLKERSLREDPFLHPGDMLIVPKNAYSKIDPFLPRPSIGMYAQRF
jgi:polysaccharide export outer membrane protein